MNYICVRLTYRGSIGDLADAVVVRLTRRTSTSVQDAGAGEALFADRAVGVEGGHRQTHAVVPDLVRGADWKFYTFLLVFKKNYTLEPGMLR